MKNRHGNKCDATGKVDGWYASFVFGWCKHRQLVRINRGLQQELVLTMQNPHGCHSTLVANKPQLGLAQRTCGGYISANN